MALGCLWSKHSLLWERKLACDLSFILLGCTAAFLPAEVSRTHLPLRTQDPACNNSLTSSYWQPIPSPCVCVCVFMLISRNNKSPIQMIRQHVHKCTQSKSLILQVTSNPFWKEAHRLHKKWLSWYLNTNSDSSQRLSCKTP